mmetsp:Transcript_5484/g.14035  ORF Transcript_5484/g.14035 Transcript_5484/m.14035 type:complete len:337 (+) Transcript_5484:389-1399(+)
MRSRRPFSLRTSSPPNTSAGKTSLSAQSVPLKSGEPSFNRRRNLSPAFMAVTILLRRTSRISSVVRLLSISCIMSTATQRWYMRKVSTMRSVVESSNSRVLPMLFASRNAPPLSSAFKSFTSMIRAGTNARTRSAAQCWSATFPFSSDSKLCGVIFVTSPMTKPSAGELPNSRSFIQPLAAGLNTCSGNALLYLACLQSLSRNCGQSSVASSMRGVPFFMAIFTVFVQVPTWSANLILVLATGSTHGRVSKMTAPCCCSSCKAVSLMPSSAPSSSSGILASLLYSRLLHASASAGWQERKSGRSPSAAAARLRCSSSPSTKLPGRRPVISCVMVCT